MSHPVLGLPPDNPRAGHPEAAARLRAERARVARLALDAALKRDPTLRERYDETYLQRFLRDYDRHIEQLARALETGDPRWVAEWVEAVVPQMRRRHVPMQDFATLGLGLADACVEVLDAVGSGAAEQMLETWLQRLKRPRHLAGDHYGNKIVHFLWKGAGVLD